MDVELEKLQERINGAESEIERIDLLNEYCYKLFRIDSEKAAKLAEESLAASRAISYEEGTAVSLAILGFCPLIFRDYEKAIFYLEEARHIFLSQSNPNIFYLSHVLNGLGICYLESGNFTLSADYLRAALNYSEELGDRALQGKVYTNLSAIYERLKLGQESLDYSKKAVKMLKKSGNSNTYLISLNNLADCYMREGDYPEAFKAMEQAFTLVKESKELIVNSMLLLTRGEVLLNLKRYSEAEVDLKAALDYAIKDSNSWDEASILTKLANLYINLGNRRSGFSYLKRALELSEKKGFDYILKEIHQTFYQLYEEKGRFKEALFHLKSFYTLRKNDFMLKSNRSFRDIEADSLRKSNERIRILSSIGRNITSNLNMKDVLATVYESINSIMEASIFGIALYNKESGQIEYEMFMEDGNYLPPFYYSVESRYSLAAYAIREGCDILINNFEVEYKDYLAVDFKLSKHGTQPQSIMVSPLKIEQDIIGIVSVQSYHKSVYSSSDIDALKALSYYIAIAISNARYTETISSKNQELHRLAITDSLTGVYNRREFEKRIKELWQHSKGKNHCFSIIIIDADHFKLINDNYGHQAGDICLRKLAESLERVTEGRADCLARYGGEEFIILLSCCREDTVDLAETILDEVRAIEVIHKDKKIKLTVSIGVSSTSELDFSSFRGPELLIDRADMALYRSKKEGRDRISYAE